MIKFTNSFYFMELSCRFANVRSFLQIVLLVVWVLCSLLPVRFAFGSMLLVVFLQSTLSLFSSLIGL
jgi:hypothetical protein